MKRLEARAAAKSELISSDPVQWITTHFYVPELRGPLLLAPYQEAVLREALRKDEHGNYIYSTIVWSDIKKSIKSTIAAAVALYKAHQLFYGSIAIVANDLKQADSRVGKYLRRAIELSPSLTPSATITNYKVTLANRTEIESIPIDPTGEAGSNLDHVVFSELWGSHLTAQKRMWTEMTLPPAKFGQSQRWVESYAGYSGEESQLEHLYEVGVVGGRLLDIGIPELELYVNDPARQLTLWNTRPRLSWQTDAYYAQQSIDLLDNEFRRVHRNQWVSATEQFVDVNLWDACRVNVPPLTPGDRIVVALDAAVSKDTFGVVGVTRHPDRPEDIMVRFSKCWKAPKGGTIDYSHVDEYVRQLFQDYNIVCYAYDPFQLHNFATNLHKDGVGWWKPFQQNAPRAIADKQLLDLILDRRITHNGEPDLREHVANANRKVDAENRKAIRIVKRSSNLPIDLCVSLSMAAAQCLKLSL